MSTKHNYKLGDKVKINGIQKGQILCIVNGDEVCKISKWYGLDGSHIESGIWYGIRLTEPTGNCDGRFKCKFPYFFKCRMKFGIFVKYESIIECINDDSFEYFNIVEQWSKYQEQWGFFHQVTQIENSWQKKVEYAKDKKLKNLAANIKLLWIISHWIKNIPMNDNLIINCNFIINKHCVKLISSYTGTLNTLLTYYDRNRLFKLSNIKKDKRINVKGIKYMNSSFTLNLYMDNRCHYSKFSKYHSLPESRGNGYWVLHNGKNLSIEYIDTVVASIILFNPLQKNQKITKVVFRVNKFDTATKRKRGDVIGNAIKFTYIF
eukprot:472678_1